MAEFHASTRKLRSTVVPQSSASHIAVIVPVKGFVNAKQRLSRFLTPREREHLARAMATRVLTAANEYETIVVSDDDEVAGWAVSLRATVVRDQGGGLNSAVIAGMRTARERGATRAVIVHADIPLAASLVRFTSVPSRCGVIVPDGRCDGTNVLSIPTDVDFAFHYGSGSFHKHHREILRLGLSSIVMPDAHLGRDVDHPRDLATARDAGLWPPTQ